MDILAVSKYLVHSNGRNKRLSKQMSVNLNKLYSDYSDSCPFLHICASKKLKTISLTYFLLLHLFICLHMFCSVCVFFQDWKKAILMYSPHQFFYRWREKNRQTLNLALYLIVTFVEKFHKMQQMSSPIQISVHEIYLTTVFQTC